MHVTDDIILYRYVTVCHSVPIHFEWNFAICTLHQVLWVVKA
jgi:hypothetical protein